MTEEPEREDSLFESIEEALSLFEGRSSKRQVDAAIKGYYRLTVLDQVSRLASRLLLAVLLRLGNLTRVNLRAATSAEGGAHDAPPLAQLLLCLLLDEKDEEIVLGDVIEEYEYLIESAGPRRARVWFYRQALQSAWPLAVKYLSEDVYDRLAIWIRDKVAIVKSDSTKSDE